MERRPEEDEGEDSANRARARSEARERLFSFAKDGNLEELQVLLNSMSVENGERAELINSVDRFGRTILHVAIPNARRQTITWILSDSGGRAAGFNKVLAKTNEGQMALFVAAQYHRWRTFRAVVEGCKVENGELAAMLNDVNEYGETVLHPAAKFGCEDIVNWLLSEKGSESGFKRDNLFALNCFKESVLHLAVAFEPLSVECLDHILSQCRHAEERCRLLFGVDKNGWTVLHRAALIGRLPIVEWVMSHLQEERGGSNEDLFALTNRKESALHFAAGGGSIEGFDFLLSRCNNTSERLRLFLGRDDKEWTIFHNAALCDKAEKISHILRKYPEESKMIIDTRDSRGMTAIHRAIIEGIDEDSRKQWGGWHREEGEEEKQAVVKSLLGLSYVEVEERGHPEKDAAAMGNDDKDGEGKKPIDAKKVVIIAAGGADPNVGLKFE